MEEVLVPKAALDWIVNGEVGTSSKVMWAEFTGTPRRTSPYRPLDAHDFGRCLGLLKAVPEWKPRLKEMRRVTPEWMALVDAWEQLTALYRQGNYVGCTRLMRRAVEEMEKGLIG